MVEKDDNIVIVAVTSYIEETREEQGSLLSDHKNVYKSTRFELFKRKALCKYLLLL